MESVRLSLWTVLLLAGIASAGAATVTVLAPEVVDVEGGSGHRGTLAEAVSRTLTEKLTAQPNAFTLIDRESLEAVLGEKATAMKKQDVPKEFQALFGSGVFFVGQISDTLLVIEAVSAQTGQSLAMLTGQVRPVTPEAITKLINAQWPAFESTLNKAIAEKPKPMITISGQLADESNRRLAWMVDDLTDGLSGQIARRGTVQVSRPRIPLVTKEERLLTVLGLTAPADGDTPARWNPTSQYQLRCVITDDVTPKVDFADSKLSVKVTLHGGRGTKSQSWTDHATVGQWETLRDRVAGEAIKRLSKTTPAPTASSADRESLARAQSKAIMEQLRPQIKVSDQIGWTGGYALRKKVVDSAMQASHLDPTNEEAAYIVALNLSRLQNSNNKTLEYIAQVERAMIETTRFFERFPKASPKRRYELMLRMYGCFFTLRYASDRPQNSRLRPLLLSPDPRVYAMSRKLMPYYGDMFIACNSDKRYKKVERGRTFWTLSLALMHSHIPAIPESDLKEQHEYWKRRHLQEIEPLIATKEFIDSGNVHPWPWKLIDAAFWARRKNPEQVKRSLTELATRYHLTNKRVWGSARDPRIRYLLQAAGAKDYATWKPNSTAVPMLDIGYRAMTRFLTRLRARHASSGTARYVPQIKGDPLLMPDSLRDRQAMSVWPSEWPIGRRPLAIFRVGRNELWMIRPNREGKQSCIYVLTIKQNGDKFTVTKGRKLDWPAGQKLVEDLSPHPCVATVDGQPVVFIGTRKYPLARFDKVNGQWKGRWYTTKDGMLRGNIWSLASVPDGDSSQLFIVGSYDTRYTERGNQIVRRTMYASKLDPKTHQISQLLRRCDDKHPYDRPALKMKDGSHWRLTEAELFPGDIKMADVAEVVWFPTIRDKKPTRVETQSGPRYFSAGKIYRYRSASVEYLFEYDLGTSKRLASAPGKRKSQTVSLLATKNTEDLMPRVHLLSKVSNVTLPTDWPAIPAEKSIGVDGVIWIGYSYTNYTGRAEYLIGYKPGPKGSKDWATHDQWIGPFVVPGRRVEFLGKWDDKHLLFSTIKGVYIVAAADIVSQMRAAGRVYSTVQWRKNRGDTSPAAVKKDKYYPLDMQLWAAHGLAREKKYAKSAQAYGRAVEMSLKLKDVCAEVFARVHQIEMLNLAGQYAETVAAVDAATARSPRLAPRGNEPLNKLYQNAKKKMERK